MEMSNKNDTIERLRDIKDRAVVSDGMFTERSAYMVKLIDDVLELLKEQELKKPNVDIDTYVCSKCGNRLEHQEMLGDNVLFNERYNYCPACGTMANWDE